MNRRSFDSIGTRRARKKTPRVEVGSVIEEALNILPGLIENEFGQRTNCEIISKHHGTHCIALPCTVAVRFPNGDEIDVRLDNVVGDGNRIGQSIKDRVVRKYKSMIRDKRKAADPKRRRHFFHSKPEHTGRVRFW